VDADRFPVGEEVVAAVLNVLVEAAAQWFEGKIKEE